MQKKNAIKKDLIRAFGNEEISKIEKIEDLNYTIISDSIKVKKVNKTLSGESIKLHFDDTSTHINKIENYISNKKSNLMKKLNDKICNKEKEHKDKEHINNLNSNKIDSDYQSQRLAKINSKVQKFVNN